MPSARGTTMKQIITFLCIVAGVYGLNPGVRVKFDIGLGFGKDFYISVPLNMSEAKSLNWTETERADNYLPSLVLYCPTERHLCAFYDDTEYISGLQISVEAEEVTDAVLDWEIQGFIKWTPSADDGTSYWAIQQYYVSEDFLEKSKEERLASRNSEKILQQDGVWLTSFNRELMKMSNSSKELEDSNFTKQTCIPGMGYHYYYNLTDNEVCSSDTLFPWFGLVYSGELIGSIYNSYGKLPIKDNQTNYFERPPQLVVKASVPDAPECQLNFVSDPGQISMHIYYVENPWAMTCLFQ